MGGGEVGSEAPYGWGPFWLGPLDMCQFCPALNPALCVGHSRVLVNVFQLFSAFIE